ncbi:exopolygalacturonase-like [Syzygium oleosum]|uniref:exopolygalacturonase-like n=1 Tax=Syzygium oleosum TaxID=219896 RepID=UPI0024BACE81|nr:exopolygalacturonase-like [Syzygium oleosum]
MKLTLRIVPMLVICLVIATCFSSPADAYVPAPSPLADDPLETAPGQSGGEPPTTQVLLVGVFDVMDYGAVADGETDSSMAFLSAWEEACAHHSNSTLYVPNNTFLVGPLSFTGPCRNLYSPRVEVRGTLKAPTSPSKFPTNDWIVFRDLHGLVLTGETGRALFDGQGSEAWKDPSCQNKSRCDKLITSLRLSNVSHATIDHINLLNGKSFHMSIHKSSNIRVHNVSIMAPGDSPNTDGIHVSHSANISITSSTIGVGDDCVSIGPGSTNISVSYVDCGPGHGISVGSLGKYKNEEKVDLIRVSNCTINGTQNGVRVKTWPGAPPSEASNMIFENIVMTNVTSPIIIDQEYCPSQQCDIQKSSLVKLSNMLFKNITGTYNSKEAVTMLCSPSVPCENVLLVGIHLNWTEQEDPRAGHVSLKGLIQGLDIINSSF